ncbi:hypothetical protein ACH4A8_03890 [Streptomyces vietnamensis]|uniref:hypothetical protein n=1 Tax=Streptomyces vietnamensis TaxID=362257 RepID=UPI0037A04051
MRRPRTAAAAVGLLLALTACESGAASGKVQGTDAELACAAVRRLPEPLPATAGGKDFDILVARLVGAEDLARAAALADAKYQPLADALDKAHELLNVTSDPKQAEPAVKKARTYC